MSIKKLPVLIILVGLLVPASLPASQYEDLRIWKEFVSDLRAGKMEDPARIRPYYPELLEPMKGYLGQLRVGIAWDRLESGPKVFRVGNQVHFVISLPYQGEGQTLSPPFCFSFLDEKGRWYFQHMETVMIRMDQLGPLPATSFPDVPAERKAWMREEIEISDQVRLFAYLAKEKGKDFAFNWFRDGAGYALAARTWIPFVPPERAFVLYLCWEFANRRENPVTLEKLTAEDALVRVTSRWFQLYEAAAHLKPQISPEDYRRLFETIWQDRATNAGWDLTISYEGEACLFRLARSPTAAGAPGLAMTGGPRPQYSPVG
jgi:hypothetical protein